MSRATLYIAAILPLASCGSSPSYDAAHTNNPEVQQCLSDSGYADIIGHERENLQIELRCRELIELRHKQH